MLGYLSKIGPVHPALAEILENKMDEVDLPSNQYYFYPQDVIGQSFFVASGFVLAFIEDSNFDELIMRIYERDSIVSGKSFMNKVESPYGILALKHSELLIVSRDTMEHVYEACPGTEELARKTLATFEDYEFKHAEFLRMNVPDKIISFYSKYPRLLKLPKPMTDTQMASYLQIKVQVFRRTRSQLRKRGMLN